MSSLTALSAMLWPPSKSKHSVFPESLMPHFPRILFVFRIRLCNIVVQQSILEGIHKTVFVANYLYYLIIFLIFIFLQMYYNGFAHCICKILVLNYSIESKKSDEIRQNVLITFIGLMIWICFIKYFDFTNCHTIAIMRFHDDCDCMKFTIQQCIYENDFIKSSFKRS